MKNKWLIGFVVLLVLGFILIGCDDVKYPYIEHGITHIGFKSGLNSWSSKQEFIDAFGEVFEEYYKNNPENDEDIYDGTAYEVRDDQWISATGGLPNNIWDIFWKDLSKYSVSIGSCWVFKHIEIPSKGANGIIYLIYAIITDVGGNSIQYTAYKGILTPKRSIMLNNTTPQRHITNGNNSPLYSGGSGNAKPQSGYRP